MGTRYPERVETVRQLAAEGNMGLLADELLHIATGYDNHWDGDGAPVLDAVRKLPEDERMRLADGLVKRSRAYPWGDPVRTHALTLAGIVGSGLPQDFVRADRLTRMEELSTAHTFHAYHELITLAEGELDAGRELPGAFVALLRRSLLDSYGVAPELSLVLDRVEDPVLNPGEAWADRALADAAGFGDAGRRLLAHLRTATSAKPTGKWEQAGRALIEEIGTVAVREVVLNWLQLVGRPRTIQLYANRHRADHNSLYDPFNADALRGVAWLTALLPAGQDTARVLGALVETSLRKVPQVGPRNPKVANAGVTGLSRTDGDAALAELARLSTRVTYKGTLNQLGAALDARAQALGLSREEIEELAVPAFGLTGVGHGEYELGESTALLEVHGSKAVLSWRNAAGKAVKSVPAAVKRDFPDELKELKAAVKDIDKMLIAQAERLDRQFLARRTWAYQDWRRRCLDHPLVGTLARRLIWMIGDTPAYFHGTDLHTLDGAPVCAAGTAVVELWHPVSRRADEVAAWQERLEAERVTQPFKQAHREVYPLTDAERTTGTYSNRFAGHILRQHQFNSLAAVRGWTARLRLSVDDSYPPAVRELPQWGLRAEYWIEGVGGRDDDDLTDSGAYTRIVTDQVRFYPIDAPGNWAHAGGGAYRQAGRWQDGTPVDPLPLTGIPEPVLSEVLRDVDLFVGVASVGNDPTWQDGGPGGRFREYWTSYGFGELSQSAAIRRELLTRLVPRLAIADRCTVDGRFLRVRGDRHAYRIHLGSGNVLIDPHERYLCIVPAVGSGAVNAGYLPFEGDRMLAVILSKAMMLARDTEITDATITSQL
ncbi:DUF4132 domain-containing protein [Streptomyces sp. NBC_01794]|uniref:DUF4132 domain-containing protein n=1 Tax=Streptomyces sp. NBC_01794 TaxID=2975942 RepID=UPI003087C2EB|nr:DUF4132 domain-containing protein [Streptomyces sp. NBC_01794]